MMNVEVRVPTAAAFDAVYRANIGFVWRVLQRFGVPTADLEDTAHEVFCVVHRRWEDFDPDAKARAWLYGIARGVARNHLRARSRRVRRLRALGDDGMAAAPVDARGLAAARELDAFLDELPEAQREVWVLSEVEGMSPSEIGAALRMNRHTISTRLRRARQRFSARFEESGPSPEVGHG